MFWLLIVFLTFGSGSAFYRSGGEVEMLVPGDPEGGDR